MDKELAKKVLENPDQKEQILRDDIQKRIRGDVKIHDNRIEIIYDEKKYIIDSPNWDDDRPNSINIIALLVFPILSIRPEDIYPIEFEDLKFMLYGKSKKERIAIINKELLKYVEDTYSQDEEDRISKITFYPPDGSPITIYRDLINFSGWKQTKENIAFEKRMQPVLKLFELLKNPTMYDREVRKFLKEVLEDYMINDLSDITVDYYNF